MSGDVVVAAESTNLGRPEGRWINPLLTKLALRIGMPKAVQLCSGPPSSRPRRR
jgi:hypothetical protein